MNSMIGLKKRDIKKALRAGAKAGGMSLADVRADIEATIDEAEPLYYEQHRPRSAGKFQKKFWK